MYCGKCGAKNDDNAKFCVKCGNPLSGGTVYGKTPGTGKKKTAGMQLPDGSNRGVSMASGIIGIIYLVGFIICLFTMQNMIDSSNGSMAMFIGLLCFTIGIIASFTMAVYLAVHFLFENGRYLVLIEAVISLIQGLIGTGFVHHVVNKALEISIRSITNSGVYLSGTVALGVFIIILLAVFTVFHLFMAARPDSFGQIFFRHLKRYPYESKLVLALVFSVFTLIGYAVIAGKAAELSSMDSDSFLSSLYMFGSFLSSLSTTLKALNFFLMSLAGVVSIGILQIRYYVSREQKPAVLLHGLVNVCTIAPLIIVLIIGAVKQDFLTVMDNQITMMQVVLLILLLVSAALAIFSLVVLGGLADGSRWAAFLPAGARGEIPGGGIQGDGTKPFPTFWKTKAFKRTIIIVIVAVAALIAFLIWNTFFNYTKVDLFENVKVTFSGYNTAGEAEVDDSNVYKLGNNNEHVAAFLNDSDISYEVKNDGSLSNGDKAVITVTYDSDAAKENKVKVAKTTEEVTVKGLTVKYQSASEIDSDLYAKARHDADEYLQTNWSDEVSDSEFYKAYYLWQRGGVDPEDQATVLIFVYKCKYTDPYSYDSSGGETRYCAVTTDFDSSYDSASARFYPDGGDPEFLTDGYDYITQGSQVKNAIASDYTDSYFIEEVTVSGSSSDKNQTNKEKQKTDSKKEKTSKKAEYGDYILYGNTDASRDHYTDASSDEYLWPTDRELITDSDLKGLSKNDLAAIMNEMYAKHGYVFQKDNWRQYFESKEWYSGSDTDQNSVKESFNDTENKNVKKIRKYQEKKGYV